MTEQTTGAELQEKRYDAGEVIFREGDESQELYVLLEGTVRIEKNGRPVARIDEPSAYFGEMSSLLGEPRSATAIAETGTGCLVVSPDRIPDLFGKTPELALRMARVLATRLAQTTKEHAENCVWVEQQGD